MQYGYCVFFIQSVFSGDLLFYGGICIPSQRGFRRFFEEKTIQLFIPWLLYSILQIIASNVLTFHEHMPFWEEMKWNFLQIRGQHDGMWFIAALFVFFMPFYFFIKWYVKSPKKRLVPLVVTSFVLSLISNLYMIYMDPNVLPWGTARLPWHLEDIFPAMFFMVLGYLFRQHWEELFDRRIAGKRVVILTVFYTAFALLNLLFTDQSLQLLLVFYRYAVNFLGLAAIIAICKRIKENRFLLFVGQNTLNYFGLHGKVFTVIQVLLHKIPFYSVILGSRALSLLFSIPLTLFIGVLLIPLAMFVNRFLPFLAGKGFRYDWKKKPSSAEKKK